MIRATVNMRHGPIVPIVSTLFAIAGCGGSSPPPSNGGSSGGADTITGRERIGWTQTAETRDELSRYRYALYVDNQRRVLDNENCTVNAAGTAADCSAPLPALGAGRHTLELAAFFVSDGSVVEGTRSVLQVTIAGLTAPAGGQIIQGGDFQSSDGVALRAEVLAQDLLDPADLAIAADGRIFVAERGGRLRIVSDQATRPSAGERDNVLADLGERPESDGTALVSVALSPDFTASGFLHVAFVSPEREGFVLQVARLREAAGLLGQPAVVAAYPLTSSDVAVILRVSPDAQLHIGIGATGPEAQDLGTFAGKILRVRPDGTTPEDNRASSPILSAGHRDPRGLTWLPRDHSLWEVERDESGDEINRIQAGANYGWPLARQRGGASSFRAPAFVVQAGSEVSGVTSVTSPNSPFFGDLIASTLADRDLLRFRIGADDQPQFVGRLLQGRFGRIAQVASGPDGALYFMTANQEDASPGQEALIRVTPRLRTLQGSRD